MGIEVFGNFLNGGGFGKEQDIGGLRMGESQGSALRKRTQAFRVQGTAGWAGPQPSLLRGSAA